jgi:simple sugar transport system substrate-binding protein
MLRLLVAGFGLFLALASRSPAAPPEGKPLKLVFITCCRDEAFFGPVKQGMRDAAKAMGVECRFTGTPGVDLKAQAAMVRQAVADGVDGIALNLIDPVALDEAVEVATRKGVPVVAFNCDDRHTPNARLAGVCQDFYRAGAALGAAMADRVPAGSTVLITQHDLGISALDDRLRGIQESLKKKGIASKVICSTNDPPEATRRIAAELKAHPEIKVVLGTGLTDTEAAGRAIQREFAGQGRLAAGFDLTPEILAMLKSGVLQMTTDQQPYVQGYYPVVQLALYCRYRIRPSNLDAGASILTSQDADRVLALTKQGYR